MNFDTTRARAAIFKRILINQHRMGEPVAAERALAEDYLARHPAGPRPAIEGDLRVRFRAMSEKLASTVDEVPRLSDAPAAVARYLDAQSLGRRAVVWPALAALDWAGAGLDVEFRVPRFDESHGADAVGITGCDCALAETGTIVLLSGPETPASTHLLPETHIALVRTSRIVATMEDAFVLMRAERGDARRMLPRALNLVSGPSRTADIEQTVVLGAHGPYRVHLIVATEE
ncbi:MAG: lactate utilization protein C [Burkholderiaceae bacterium]